MSDHLYVPNKKRTSSRGEQIWPSLEGFPTASCIWSLVEFRFSKSLDFGDLLTLFCWENKDIKNNHMTIQLQNVRGTMRITLPNNISLAGVTHSFELQEWKRALNKLKTLGGDFRPFQGIHESPFSEFNGLVKQIAYSDDLRQPVDLIKLFKIHGDRIHWGKYDPIEITWRLNHPLDYVTLRFSGPFFWNTQYPANIETMRHIVDVLKQCPLDNNVQIDKQSTIDRLTQINEN